MFSTHGRKPDEEKIQTPIKPIKECTEIQFGRLIGQCDRMKTNNKN